VVVVEEHHEALLVPDEERGSTVAQTFRRLRQGQAQRTHLGERLGDFLRREPAHDTILKLLGQSRGGSAAVVVARS
jgi:hypothetical protein